MARLLVQRGDFVVTLEDVEITYVDELWGRFQIEIRGEEATAVLQMSKLEAIGLSAELRSEIGYAEERSEGKHGQRAAIDRPA